jgi:hypothetical protein
VTFSLETSLVVVFSLLCNVMVLPCQLMSVTLACA